MKNLKVALFLPVLALAFFIGVSDVSAAGPGTLRSCYFEPEDPYEYIVCGGDDWYDAGDISITASTSDTCNMGTVIDVCTDVQDGTIQSGGCAPGYILTPGYYYLYATQDSCATTSNVVEIQVGPAPPPTFTESLGAGLFGVVGDMGDYFGPIVLTVVGFALGLYGIKLGIATLTRYVSVKGEGPKRRRRKS